MMAGALISEPPHALEPSLPIRKLASPASVAPDGLAWVPVPLACRSYQVDVGTPVSSCRSASRAMHLGLLVCIGPPRFQRVRSPINHTFDCGAWERRRKKIPTERAGRTYPSAIAS